jgi:hypothetical protein
MADNPSRDALKVIGTVAVVGLGVALAAAVTSTNNRANFAELIRGHLPPGVTLVNSELGRNDQQALWILTVGLPQEKFLTLRVPLRTSQGPFAPETARSVALRVVDYLRSHNLLDA